MKIVDQIYQCEVPGEVFGHWNLQCHLRIFEPHPEVQTVVITNMGFEMGWFIPYLVEQLIEQVIQDFQLDPYKLTWIEHYTPTFKKPTCTDFSQVTFEWCNGKAIHPHWTAISPETANALMSSHLLPA